MGSALLPWRVIPSSLWISTASPLVRFVRPDPDLLDSRSLIRCKFFSGVHPGGHVQQPVVLSKRLRRYSSSLNYENLMEDKSQALNNSRIAFLSGHASPLFREGRRSGPILGASGANRDRWVIPFQDLPGSRVRQEHPVTADLDHLAADRTLPFQRHSPTFRDSPNMAVAGFQPRTLRLAAPPTGEPQSVYAVAGARQDLQAQVQTSTSVSPAALNPRCRRLPAPFRAARLASPSVAPHGHVG